MDLGLALKDEERSRIAAAYEQIKACIERESDLVVKWLTMLILINAGLVAAALQVYLQIRTLTDQAALLASFVGLFISMAALLATGFIFFAIDASSDQFEYLRRRYVENQGHFDRLSFPRPFGDENEEQRTKLFPRQLYGVMGKPYVIPAAVFVLWLVILAAMGWWPVSAAITAVGFLIYYVHFHSKKREIAESAE